MSRPDDRDRARVLARKADGDDKAMKLLASNPEIDDESVGFHAQQAIEKRLKAVMAARGFPLKKEHDLGVLLENLAAAGIEAPPGADWIDELTVYARGLRYEELLDAEPLDREAVVTLVGQVGEWAGRLIDA
ncbi:MAG TPA: HEPN domain-containing protein [Solirubrobacterales bacterium]|nr:HEPN domain-containing protein [Solirubrobacterales bacterium]